MAQEIKVRIETNYGTERIYPVTYKTELETLTGQKTLTQRNINALKRMGFEFTVEVQQRTF